MYIRVCVCARTHTCYTRAHIKVTTCKIHITSDNNPFHFSDFTSSVGSDIWWLLFGMTPGSDKDKLKTTAKLKLQCIIYYEFEQQITRRQSS